MDVPAVANVHSVRVSAPSEDLTFSIVTPSDRRTGSVKPLDVPQDDAFDADALADHSDDGPGVPRAEAAIDDAPPAQDDVFPLQVEDRRIRIALFFSPYTNAPSAM